MGYDARTHYTKMVIHDSFMEALHAKPLAKVTVKEICDRAQINRATFYRYYDNPLDLMDKIEDELLGELVALVGETDATRMRDVLLVMLAYLRENADVCLVLFGEHGDAGFTARAMEACLAKALPSLGDVTLGRDERRRTWLFRYMAQGCAATFGQWMRDGMEEDPEELADFLVACNTRLLA